VIGLQPSFFDGIFCHDYAQCAIVLEMEAESEFIPDGTVTSPNGFYAGATFASIKKEGKDNLDLGILFSKVSATAAALFTTNKIKAAPIILSQKRIQAERATALIVNSGVANACTSEQGLDDAAEMAALTAKSIGVPTEEVLVASTGVIGQRLPMQKVRAGIKQIAHSTDGGHKLARAIMTTDTAPKEAAITVKTDTDKFTIGGIAKGSGMVHPDLSTFLCFLTTDAAIEPDFLRSSLKKTMDISFNMVSIDGDTSTNDMVLIMANGMAENQTIQANNSIADTFQQALDNLCVFLAKSIARDGEGATKLIEVTVSGTLTATEARQAARTITSSPLVKAAIHGNDPNWGRILAAAGRSGIELEETRIDLYLGDICLVKEGRPLPFDQKKAEDILTNTEVRIHLQLNLGTATATAWGCDLAEEYVTINSQYTT
jgi:glutamate N-acetyltransferase/amino-acid N-acetyltransferase